MIKNIKLFVNNNEKSIEVAKIARDKFIENNFVIDDDRFDLGVAIGGDGSFLRMVKNTKFDSNPYYVGINTGHLGFLQEVKPEEIDDLIERIKKETFRVDKIGIQGTSIFYGDNKRDDCYSLNEIVILKSAPLKAVDLAVKIDNDFLENYKGDGLLIATSVGSTAHNLSLGGSIVYDKFSTLQINPIGPLNSKSYRTLTHPLIIPDTMDISVIPREENGDYIVIVDGEDKLYNDVKEINTTIKKKIKMLRSNQSNFFQKIRDKFIDEE